MRPICVALALVAACRHTPAPDPESPAIEVDPPGCWPRPELLAFDSLPDHLAVDDDWVYFFTVAHAIARVPREGGAEEVLVTGVDSPTGLAIAGDELRWSDASRGAFAVALAGGKPRRLAEPPVFPSPLETEDARFRFFAMAKAGEVWRVEKATGASAKIFDVQGAPWHDAIITAIATDGAHLYVASHPWQRDGGHVGRVDPDGSHATLLDTVEVAPSQLLPAGGELYYSTVFNMHAALARLCVDTVERSSYTLLPMLKQYLLTPGPTPVPERVMLAMAQPIVHHRMPAFTAIFNEAAEGLKWIFQTKQPVLMLAGSGTLAMEAAVVNTMKRGDKALCVVGGKFGERWRNLCKAFGIESVNLDVEWGKAIDPQRIKQALDADDKITAVFSQANESSTGVRHPVEEIAKITAGRERIINVVDAVSALGAFDLPMDKAGFDVVVTGSQKALMLPPGQAYIALSEKAWARSESADLPKFYADLKREKKAQAGGETAYTPAVTLTIGLSEALRMLKEEGLENIFSRHDRLARATRAACEAMGCKLFAPDAPSPTVTSVWGPGGLDTGKLVKQLRDKYGVSITGGQDAVKGKIFRVAHLGYFGTFDILTSVSACEMALADLGVAVTRGAGVAAAEAILQAGAAK